MINVLQRGSYIVEGPADLIEIQGHKFKKVTRMIGQPYTDYEPVQAVPAGYLGWMYDGSTVAIVDGDTLVQYKVRDRAETVAEYEVLSR